MDALYANEAAHMTYGDCVTRLRRLLRDHDAAIWTDAALMIYFNQSQLEVATKTSLLQRADVYPYPSRFTWSFLFDWEAGHTEGDRYQALNIWQVQDTVASYVWEAAYWMDEATPAEEGYRWTHCWETAMCAPADVVPVQLHKQLWSTIHVAWDRKPLKVISQRDIALIDRYFKTRQGIPTHCYPLDDQENRIVLYPRPASVVWPEEAPSQTFNDDEGIVAWTETDTETADLGIITDQADMAFNVTYIYSFLPRLVESEADEMDWPDFLIHCVECATLERAFGADTDGYIPSLRDYWKSRKEMGLKAINLLKGQRTNDRSFRMGSARRPARSIGPRLPDHYPAV